MEIRRGSRFSVLAVEGWAIWPQSTGKSSRDPSTSYCIVDRDWNHREVYSDYWPQHLGRGGTGAGKWLRRQRAFNRPDELEREYGS